MAVGVHDLGLVVVGGSHCGRAVPVQSIWSVGACSENGAASGGGIAVLVSVAAGCVFIDRDAGGRSGLSRGVLAAERGSHGTGKRRRASQTSALARWAGATGVQQFPASREPEARIVTSPPLHTTMALARPLPPLWQNLFPALNGPVRPVLNLPLLQRLSQPFRTLPTPFAALAAPALSLPSIPSLGDIWEGILKAVPKKKTSYSKKRKRFMLGRGATLEDLTNLNKCSACGRIKRAHLLCPYCVHSMCGFVWARWTCAN